VTVAALASCCSSSAGRFPKVSHISTCSYSGVCSDGGSSASWFKQREMVSANCPYISVCFIQEYAVDGGSLASWFKQCRSACEPHACREVQRSC
jgi:hypothetical protein